ncbi:zinc finger, CCHC-type containing protein [Tanacetum coccineum]|uniref:Zinc finger, CCHC-type containing protein n=1 Tax=Tanacetum coccineum TaxID=301880 RepID=A0ABQ5IM49_9ASTR
MGDENPIRTLGDYSKLSQEGYRNTIELPVGNNVVPLRSDTIQLVQNGCSFHGLRTEDPIQHHRDFLRIVDFIDLNDDTRNTTRLRLFHFSLYDQAINWLDLLPAGSISTWDDLTTRFLAQFFPPGRTAELRNDILMFQQFQIFYDHVDYTTQMAIDYATGERLRKLRPEEAWETIEDSSLYEDHEIQGRYTYEGCNLADGKKRRRREGQAARRIYGCNYGRFHATLFGGHKEVKGKDNRRMEQDEKDQEDNKPGANNNRNVKSRYYVENTSPQSTLQVLPSIPPVTYPKEVENTLGTPIEVEPLNETKLEEVGLNCNHNTSLSSREISSFDGPEPQPLLNSPSLDVSLGDVIDPEPPIKPHSPDSSRIKVVDYLTTQTLPSPHMANSHPKGVDIFNWEMFDDDWGLESKEVSPLEEELSLFDRPNEVERGRILEAHRLESILQQ